MKRNPIERGVGTDLVEEWESYRFHRKNPKTHILVSFIKGDAIIHNQWAYFVGGFGLTKKPIIPTSREMAIAIFKSDWRSLKRLIGESACVLDDILYFTEGKWFFKQVFSKDIL